MTRLFKRNPDCELVGRDLLNRTGNDALIRHLKEWWHSRGYTDVRFERYEIPGTVGSYGVSSNLVGGKPPSMQQRVAA